MIDNKTLNNNNKKSSFNQHRQIISIAKYGNYLQIIISLTDASCNAIFFDTSVYLFFPLFLPHFVFD